MPSVFFKITKSQEKEVYEMMEQEGYTSKTEFFRFLIKFYKYHGITPQHAEKSLIVKEKSSDETTIDRSTPDENLSEETQKMLANPYLFDEEVRQLVREMDPLYSHTPIYIEKRGA